MQWLGQAAFKIPTVAGKVIVIGPWLKTNLKTPEAYKNLEALGKVDMVLVSHGNFDHIADAPANANMHNAPLWAPAGLSQSLGILGVLPGNLATRMNKSGTVNPPVKVMVLQPGDTAEF